MSGILNIRGQFGHQILELFVGLAKAIEKKEDVNFVLVNTDNHTNKKERITDVFRMKKGILIGEKKGIEKQNAWTKENIALAFKHREEILSEYLEFKNLPDFMKVDLGKNFTFNKKYTILHVRGKDKQIISFDNYLKLYLNLEANFNVEILGDDSKLIAAIYNVNNFPLTCDLYDWFTMFESKNIDIYCGLSSFVFSLLMIDPKLNINIIPIQFCDLIGKHKVDFKPIESFMINCPNVKYVNDEMFI